ncbi:conserved Plasmodium protein, unknown function [Plasmodium sp. gorilla clade G2]|uniref:conserved Plasmodium protein, unknown function n=1 Tax=Plasmodium sp. gorilla clade G2 TaxID=880535 RepID=UPI000D21136F|nr:conserved Plasmodium protein, unknown function [Plasmodium sp. gorilla clade G2]SOV13623.1 conserved Plasmodium protein, unknown function [Plasmodium sp. gorilla clade G2]
MSKICKRGEIYFNGFLKYSKKKQKKKPLGNEDVGKIKDIKKTKISDNLKDINSSYSLDEKRNKSINMVSKKKKKSKNNEDNEKKNNDIIINDSKKNTNVKSNKNVLKKKLLKKSFTPNFESKTGSIVNNIICDVDPSNGDKNNNTLKKEIKRKTPNIKKKKTNNILKLSNSSRKRSNGLKKRNLNSNNSSSYLNNSYGNFSYFTDYNNYSIRNSSYDMRSSHRKNKNITKRVCVKYKYELPTIASLGKVKKLDYLGLTIDDVELNKKSKKLLYNLSNLYFGNSKLQNSLYCNKNSSHGGKKKKKKKNYK